MATSNPPIEEMAQHTVTQWFQELQDKGISVSPSMSLREVTVNVIASLLDSLTRPNWQEAALLNLRVLRFLADQLNFPLEQSLEIFLRLRRHLVRGLAILLGDTVEAYNRVETVWDEGILRLAAHRQTATLTALDLAHQKYYALFEQASDSFLLIRMDESGTIVEANPAASQLTGYSLEELHGMSALALAPTEELEKYRDALFELRRTGQTRKMGIGLKRKDGMIVIVDLSATLLVLNGVAHALCIARDVTEQQRMQRRLESVVAHRTKELAQALERERHRAAQMTVLSQIAAEALEAVNEDAVYQVAAQALKEHLALYNVALFAYDKNQNELVLKSCKGAYEEVWSSKYRQSANIGLLGLAIRTGEPILANDVKHHPDYFQATPAEAATRSELVVPIKLHGEIIGVLDLQSEQEDAFDEKDLQMAQAVADQVAHALETISHFNHLRILQELNEQIVENLPHAVALLDEKGTLIIANEQFCQEVCRSPREAVIGRYWKEVIPEDLQRSIVANHHPPMEETISAAIKRRQDFFYPEIPYGNVWFDIRVIPIRGAQQNRVMIHIRDASLRVRRIYQLETLMAIAQAMESTFELNRLLHAILTAATAGPGLGFNRAILFLIDKSSQVLRTAMAVGSLTAEEAYATWARLAAERKTLWDFLREYPGDEAVRQTPLMQYVRDLEIPLDDSNLLSLCLSRREPIKVVNPFSEPRLPERLRALLGDSEAICVPLVAQEEWLGVIIADNAFSRHPITEEAERLLRLFASSASVTLRNAQLITELKEALEREQKIREQLVHSERLAAIGELAAKIAHDLRSPLVTIGGYARQLQRNLSDPQRVQRNVQIIVDEVERLERQLRDLLDFATPKPPNLQRLNLNEMIRRLAEIHLPSMEAAGVQLVIDLPPNPLFVLADEIQVERVVVNLLRNAVEAMPDGGILSVKVWSENEFVKISVRDTGIGIIPDELPHIFKPFYTTKSSGSGLGLAICKKIVDDHGGQIEVVSSVGEGTTFTITLPAAN
ncbi:MAG: GAF domain-containing protein [Armatimonadetes bacterium]|nr:GAF domain-containing protein [Armatimonadota bacterium]MCX7966901.1 GAF domain-containing protein [Armatimonadota bacterium]MDW8141859.1 GAF domain-containing protein [Armatimonadota bacterium]